MFQIVSNNSVGIKSNYRRNEAVTPPVYVEFNKVELVFSDIDSLKVNRCSEAVNESPRISGNTLCPEMAPTLNCQEPQFPHFCTNVSTDDIAQCLQINSIKQIATINFPDLCSMSGINLSTTGSAMDSPPLPAGGDGPYC